MLRHVMGSLKIFQRSQESQTTHPVDLGHHTYWGVLAITFIGPFLLGFHHSLSFNKRWRGLLKSALLILCVYAPWDMWFTHMGVWSFHESYFSGVYIGNLPLEELLFFIATPFACLFVLECIRYYFPSLTISAQDSNKKFWSKVITFLFLLAGLYLTIRNPTGWYTLSAVITGCMGLMYLQRSRKKEYLQILVTWIILLIPFYVCNGILTGIHFWEYPLFNFDQVNIDNAVVRYNNLENSALRIWSVPAEDFFYGLGFYSIGVAHYRSKEN